MKNQALADIFDRIGDILELRGKDGDKFRIISYRKAALIIRELPNDIEDIYKAGTLEDIPGVGKALAEKITNFIEKGKIPQYEKLKKEFPPTIFDLMAIPHLGPKKVKVLFEELGVVDIPSLEKVLDDGTLSKLPGFGEKTAENIREGIRLRKTTMNRTLLGEIYLTVEELIRYMKKCKAVKKIEPAGSFRRKRETIGDVDLLATGSNTKKIIDHFIKHPDKEHVMAHGDTKGSLILKGDQQVDLRVVDAKEWGAALQYFTGSKQHNVSLRSIAKEKGIKLNEYGAYKGKKRIAGETEASMYKCIGMQYVPPEMREDRGEIELAQKKKVPKLVELKDMKGDVHMHTNWSDGSNTIKEMAQAAKKQGYEYVALTDHSPSLVIANGLTPKRLKEKQKELEKIRKEVKIEVLSGTEVDILADGSLDYSDKVLKELDMVVASIHSRFNQDNTERMIKAMKNKYVHAIGHPSGRLIGVRDGYGLDYPKIFKVAAETGTWLEINAQYLRLDLQEKYIQEAKKAGVKFVINTDSHQEETLWLMTLGISTARRGWLTKEDIVNTLPWSKFKKELAKKRK